METSAKYNRYAARIPRGIGVVGLIGSLRFDVQGSWGLARFRPIRTDRKRGEGEVGVKIEHFSRMLYMYGPILILKIAVVFFTRNICKKTFHVWDMWKFFLETSRINKISQKSKAFCNVRFSTHYFHMKTKILPIFKFASV